MDSSNPSRFSDLSHFAPLAAVAIAMLSITSGASLAKSIFPLIGPAGTTTLRLSIAAMMLALVFRIWRLRFARQTLLTALPYGVSLGFMNLLFYMAIQRVPLGIGLAVEFTGPLALALFASRRRADLFWIALAVFGLSLLLPFNLAQDAVDPVGIGLAFAAGLCWAAYILTGQRAGHALGASAPAFGTIVAALVTLPFGIMEAGSDLLAPDILVIALGVALLSSAIPFSLEMYALRRLPARSFGILTSGEPAIGAVAGAIWLGETLPLAKWLGIAAIVAASIGTTRAARGSAGKAVAEKSEALES